MYQYNKVKHKVPFLEEEIYPVYISIVHGRKSLNFKSRVFSHLIKTKYQVCFRVNGYSPCVQDIIEHEKAMVAFIIQKLGSHFTTPLFKKEYAYYSADLYGVIDEYCTGFLLNFFNQHSHFSYTVFLMQTSKILTADIILNYMQTILPVAIRDKLFDNLVPYIRLIEFCKQQKQHGLPMLTAFSFSEKTFQSQLSLFLNSELDANRSIQCLSELIKNPPYSPTAKPIKINKPAMR